MERTTPSRATDTANSTTHTDFRNTAHRVATPVVRRIDHIIIRIDDSQYEEFYSFLADTLRLPTPWPPTEHPAMRSGGIFAGNVDFEILYVPSESAADPDEADRAKLYGIVWEAWEESTAELMQRGLSYLPTPYFQHERGKPPKLLWMNYFFESFVGSNGWQKLIFGMKKLIPDKLWIQSATRSSGNAKAVQWMFNQVFKDGIVFMVKYNPAWRNIDAERRISLAQLEMRAGGVLGLIRVKEIAVGTTQLMQSSARWRKLLYPAIEETGLCWQAGDGPALRVITAENDGIHHMVWEVVSLAEARETLSKLDLLGLDTPDEITLDPAKCFGLDIRLVEAPGAFTGV